MRAQNGLRTTKTTQWRTGATVLLVALAAVLAGPATRSAAAASPPPALRHLTVSPGHLSDQGGRVTFHADLEATTHCSIHVRPHLPNLPKSKPCNGQHLTWKVHLPHNRTVDPVHYHFTLTAKGSHHREVQKHRKVTVARTNAPPMVSHLSVTPSSIGFEGGPVTVSAHLSASKSCAIDVTPAISGYPRTGGCRAATKTWTVRLPTNSATTAVTYQISVTATGTHGHRTSATAQVTVAAHPPPCPGQTSTATPTTTAFFNNPTTRSVADQTAVVTAMINLICDVQPPGPNGPSEIDLASYVYQLDNVSQALLWAHKYMDANVHLALDGANEWVTAIDGTVSPNTAYNDLVAGLPSGSVLLCGPNAGVPPPPPSPGDDTGNGRPFPSGTGCAGDNIMHTKLLLVSAVDSERDPAVFTSSQNFSTTAEVSAFNNGLQVVGNDEVFDDDQAYFQQLRTDKQQADIGDTLSSADTSMSGMTLHTYYYPRNSPPVFPTTSGYDKTNDSATDNVGDLLSNVGCGNPGSVAGDHSGSTAKTTVQVAMYDFGNRKIIRNKLESLADRGCEVSIVYAEMTDGTFNSFEKHPDITLSQIDDLAYPFPDGSGTGYIFVHDKYLLVSGAIQTPTGTQRDQNLVLTGSQNFTEHGLHNNDEATISLQQTATDQSSSTVFGQYEADWGRLVQAAAHVTPTPG